MRAILFLLLIVLIFLVVRFTLQRIRFIRAQQDAEARAQEHAQKVAAETMVICQVCQVHLPQNEAIQDGDAFYCSEAHHQMANKAQS
ncbi:PP0621 family protein [Thiosulfativibrio zosterae]|uniref:Preprotein translocase subunit YajC n=1 Tax=Thiosulfativibrio zosterae TaxID=2675053 RepID=A0A6F8PN74_9GAMM|nr:PP0621 family protein [Thiosulfativibrio zosterae]BBP43487.1 hypothetical protein THMIRHAT_12330 [Thiosulfativibrio zosterae]